MAEVTKIDTVKAFCPNFDQVTCLNAPNLPAKVRRGFFRKGDVVIFDQSVPRHVYRQRYFYGKIYTPDELGFSNVEVGQQLEIPNSENWGFT